MRERTRDGVQALVHVLRQILGQKTIHELSPFLQQGVLASVAAVGLRIRQMLRAVQLGHQAQIGAPEVDFHPTPTVEGD